MFDDLNLWLVLGFTPDVHAHLALYQNSLLRVLKTHLIRLSASQGRIILI